MYIFNLAFKRLISRPANSLLSLLLFAIGISIISLILLADRQMKDSVQRNLAGVDLVMGAKGSPVQLILSSVLHADYPTGNINLREAENIARNPLVKQYIPLALGDNYRGFRIVGTTIEYSGLYNAELYRGQWFESVFEATVGYRVAQMTGLEVGDHFYGVHGFRDVGHAHDYFHYSVSGIMAPTGTVLDNLILTPVETVWAVHDGQDHTHDEHDHENCDHEHDEHADCDQHHEHDHDDSAHHEHDSHNHHFDDHQENPQLNEIRARIEAGEDISREEMELFLATQQQAHVPGTDDHREITAMLLIYRSPAANIQLPRMINESTNMQAASPALELNRLFSLLAFGFDALNIIAWAIIIISGINIFVHLWNTLRRGIHEIALMRVMGASRHKVFIMLLLQGMILAFGGWITGVILARAIWMFLPSFHFMPDVAFIMLQPGELLLLVYALATGILASIIPAWLAYKTDIHFTLTRPENA
ncbi:MAG: FtsX-like permease family protein [Bacteroidales bacterium]|nr:FtsX-like permease family protein [Bacteroidales bacterium]